MKNKFLALITLTYVLFYSACSTDVDIIADYKEKAVIYGLLDISQSIQYIKVNKVFLGVGDANQMAKVSDSINYKPDDINVVLDEIKEGRLIKTILLYDTTLLSQDQGVFSKDPNIIYYTKETLDPTALYTLKVSNNKTGYKAEASTNIIKNISFVSGRTSYNFVGSDGKYSLNNSIEWNSVPFGKVYQLVFRFHYKEFKVAGDTAYKTIDWLFTPQNAASTSGGAQMKKGIKGEEFFAFLKSVKSAYFGDNSYKRIAYRGQLIVTAVGENYQIYSDLNAPSSSNFQEKPIYTNVNNGVGIFDSRVTSFDPPKPFNSFTIDEIVNGKYTDDLNFIRI